MGKIEQIKQSIENAEQGISKLTPEVLSIGGYTSNKIRHLLNNLGTNAIKYFEIGSHLGSTFCSTVYKNENIQLALACDNYSEFNDGKPKVDFLNNAHKFCKSEWHLIQQDAFTIKGLHMKPDLYLYDGSHSEFAQRMALVHFYNMLTDEFVYLVDDYQWKAVKTGTQDGIKECGFQVLFEQELGMETPSSGIEYWNGMYIALLKKTK